MLWYREELKFSRSSRSKHIEEAVAFEGIIRYPYEKHPYEKPNTKKG